MLTNTTTIKDTTTKVRWIFLWSFTSGFCSQKNTATRTSNTWKTQKNTT